MNKPISTSTVPDKSGNDFKMEIFLTFDKHQGFVTTFHRTSILGITEEIQVFYHGRGERGIMKRHFEIVGTWASINWSHIQGKVLVTE